MTVTTAEALLNHLASTGNAAIPLKNGKMSLGTIVLICQPLTRRIVVDGLQPQPQAVDDLLISVCNEQSLLHIALVGVVVLMIAFSCYT